MSASTKAKTAFMCAAVCASFSFVYPSFGFAVPEIILDKIMPQSIAGPVPGWGVKKSDIVPGRYWKFSNLMSRNTDKPETSLWDLNVLEVSEKDGSILLMTSVTDMQNITDHGLIRLSADLTTGTELLSAGTYDRGQGWEPLRQDPETTQAPKRGIGGQRHVNENLVWNVTRDVAADGKRTVRYAGKSDTDTSTTPNAKFDVQTMFSKRVSRYDKDAAVAREIVQQDKMAYFWGNPPEPHFETKMTTVTLVETGLRPDTKTKAWLAEGNFVLRLKSMQKNALWTKPWTLERKVDSDAYLTAYPNGLFKKSICIEASVAQILDPEGKPVAGALVGVSGVKNRDRGICFHFKTDNDGMCIIPISYAAYIAGTKENRLFAVAPGLVFGSVPCDINSTMTLTLKRGTPMDFQIEDCDGHPVTGAAVSLIPKTCDVGKPMMVGMVSETQNSGMRSFSYGIGEETSVPGVIRFMVDEATSVPLSVVVNKDGLINRYVSHDFVTPKQANGAPVKVKLPKPATLKLDLTQEGGKQKRLIDWSVSVDRIDMSAKDSVTFSQNVNPGASDRLRALPYRETLTGCVPGEYNIIVKNAKRERMDPFDILYIGTPLYDRETTITLQPGETRDLPMVVTPRGPKDYEGTCTLTVKLLLSSGQPCADVPLRVVDRVVPVGTGLVGYGVTDAQGVCTLSNVRAGQYLLEVVTKKEDMKGVMDYPAPLASRSVSLQDADTSLTINMDKKPAGEKLLTGDPAPDFEATDIESGAKVKLSDLRGKPVFLEFWATWCGPCQNSMEGTQNVVSQYKGVWGDKAVVLGVSLDGTTEVLKKHLDAKKWKEIPQWWVGHETFQSQAAQAYGIQGIPAAFLIDENGIIRWGGHPGAVPGGLAALMKKYGKFGEFGIKVGQKFPDCAVEGRQLTHIQSFSDFRGKLTLLMFGEEGKFNFSEPFDPDKIVRENKKRWKDKVVIARVNVLEAMPFDFDYRLSFGDGDGIYYEMLMVKKAEAQKLGIPLNAKISVFLDEEGIVRWIGPTDKIPGGPEALINSYGNL